MPDSDRRRCVNRDSKEIRIPQNDLIHGRRTGIIITLLPISSETVETGDEKKRENGRIGARETEGKREEGDREEERGRREEEREETRGRNETRKRASNVSL